MGMLDLFAGLELLVANWLLFLYVGDGEYRLFFLPGIGAGFFAWKKTLGGIIRKGSGLFWLWCFLPVAGIGRILKKFMEKQKKFLKYLFSNRKKSVKIKEQHSISGGENGG